MSASDGKNRPLDYAGFIWSVADLLRGDYKQSEYGRVVLPLTVLRRLDCVLAPTKARVLERAEALEGRLSDKGPVLNRITGVQFHNASPLDLAKVLDDPPNAAEGLCRYVAGFPEDVRDTSDRVRAPPWCCKGRTFRPAPRDGPRSRRSGAGRGVSPRGRSYRVPQVFPPRGCLIPRSRPRDPTESVVGAGPCSCVCGCPRVRVRASPALRNRTTCPARFSPSWSLRPLPESLAEVLCRVEVSGELATQRRDPAEGPYFLRQVGWELVRQ